METIKKIKIILDITDDELDDLFNIYVDNATNYILDYTRLSEVPKTLESLIVDMVIFQFRQRELENVKSESMGAMSYSFITEYPENITNRLNSYKRALFL